MRGFPASWGEPQALINEAVSASREVKYLFVVFGGTASVRMVRDAEFGRAARVTLKVADLGITAIFTHIL